MKCRTPSCSRQATVDVTAPYIWEADDDEAPMCVPCYLALTEGVRRHPGNISWSTRDGVELSDSRREALHP